MRNFFNALFGKHKKITDTVFLTRISVSIVLIIVMLISLTFSAYGYFSDTLSSAKSVTSSSSYSLKITPPIDAASIYASGGESYFLDNSLGSAEKEYIFNLVTADGCTASVGYCKIELMTDKNNASVAEDRQIFYTDSIWNMSFSADATKTVSRNIVIKVPAGKSAKVNLIGEWGTCSSPMSGDTIEPEFAQDVIINDDNTQNTEIDNQ